MKFSTWLFFSVAAVAIAALWLVSAFHKVQTDFTLRQHAYHVAVHGPHLSIMIFSIVPEEDDYRQYTLHLWPVETSALVLSALLGYSLLRTRRLAHARGFPLTPLDEKKPADSYAGS